MKRRVLAIAIIAVAGLLGGAQLVPYGRDHDNPPALLEPPWDTQQTRELAVRACFDCHSNLTSWPWYSTIAPLSWRIQSNVEAGRSDLNFSEWDRWQEEGEEAGEAVLDGEMPPWEYTALHPSARLTGQETAALAAGLAATMGEVFSSDHDEDDD